VLSRPRASESRRSRKYQTLKGESTEDHLIGPEVPAEHQKRLLTAAFTAVKLSMIVLKAGKQR
jgi:hypothetical protein